VCRVLRGIFVSCPNRPSVLIMTDNIKYLRVLQTPNRNENKRGQLNKQLYTLFNAHRVQLGGLLSPILSRALARYCFPLLCAFLQFGGPQWKNFRELSSPTLAPWLHPRKLRCVWFMRVLYFSCEIIPRRVKFLYEFERRIRNFFFRISVNVRAGNQFNQPSEVRMESRVRNKDDHVPISCCAWK